METLAMPKTYREIHLYSSNKSIMVALENAPDRKAIMSSKDNILELDGHVIRSSAIACVNKTNPFYSDKADTAMAYAKSLSGGMKYVAIERVQRWEGKQENQTIKMPISSLQQWITSFQKSPELFPDYQKILSSFETSDATNQN